MWPSTQVHESDDLLDATSESTSTSGGAEPCTQYDANGFPADDWEAYGEWMGSDARRCLMQAVDAAGGWYGYLVAMSHRNPDLPPLQHLLPPDAATAVPNHWVREIDVDVPRTFARYRHREALQSTLGHVLQAYASWNPQVGYCQGMNFIAALCLAVMNEAQAFDVLVYIVHRLLPDYYEHVTGAMVDHQLVTWMLWKTDAPLMEHLADLDFTLVSIWDCLFCLFAASVPSEAALALWGLVFSRGRLYHLRVVWAFFSTASVALLAVDDAGAAQDVLARHAVSMYNTFSLMVAADESISVMGDDLLRKEREERLVKQQMELADQQRQRDISDLIVSTGLDQTALQHLSEEFLLLAGLPLKSASPTRNGGTRRTIGLSQLQQALLCLGIDLELFSMEGLFRQWDTDGVGALSFPQLMKGLMKFAPQHDWESRFLVCAASFDPFGMGTMSQEALITFARCAPWRPLLEATGIVHAQSTTAVELADGWAQSPLPITLDVLLNVVRCQPLHLLPSLVRNGLALQGRHLCTPYTKARHHTQRGVESTMHRFTQKMQGIVAGNGGQFNWVPSIMQSKASRTAVPGWAACSLSPQAALRAMALLSVPCTIAASKGNFLWSTIREDENLGICIKRYAPGVTGSVGKTIRSFQGKDERKFRIMCTVKPHYVLAWADQKDDISDAFHYLQQLLWAKDLKWHVQAYDWLAAFRHEARERPVRVDVVSQSDEEEDGKLHKLMEEAKELATSCATVEQLWDLHQRLKEVPCVEWAVEEVQTALQSRISCLMQLWLTSTQSTDLPRLVAFKAQLEATLERMGSSDQQFVLSILPALKAEVQKWHRRAPVPSVLSSSA